MSELTKVSPGNRIRLLDYPEKSYAESRLLDCVVRVIDSGCPALFQGFSDLKAVVIKADFDSLKTPLVEEDLDNIQISHFPLGFSLISGCTYYVLKTPSRAAWKQGLYCKNVRYFAYSNQEGYFTSITGRNVDTRDFIPPFLDHYPTMSQALTMLDSNDFPSVPIDRNFCLDHKMNLFYRTSSIGKFNREKGVLSIKRKFEFLKEHEIKNSKVGQYLPYKGDITNV